jgi:hypothetical protein
VPHRLQEFALAEIDGVEIVSDLPRPDGKAT